MSLSLALAIHLQVNSRVHFEPDPPGTDIWTVAKKYGDCEDYALAKRELLIAKGVPPEDIQILLFYDKLNRSGHVVLYLPKQDKVSDSQRDVRLETMARFKGRTGFRFVCETVDLRPINLNAGARCSKNTPRSLSEKPTLAPPS